MRPLCIAGQENTAAALLEKNYHAFNTASQDAEAAFTTGNEVLAEGKKRNDKKLMANAYNTIGWAYLHKGRTDSATAMLERSKELFSLLEQHEDIIKVNINLAETYNRQHQYVAAIERLLEADSLSNRVKHLPLQTDVKRLMGIVYRQTGDNEKAVGYFRQALNGFEWQKDYLRYNSTLISMSIL